MASRAAHTRTLDDGLAVRPGCPAALRAVCLPADDSFLEDAGSLIGFLHTDTLRLTGEGRPNQEDLDRFMQRLYSSV